MSVGIIIKNYSHINRSLPNWDCPTGRIVKNKDHYDRLCKENGMVSYEQAEELAASKKCKEYKISDKSLAIINSAKQCADKKGNVKLSSRTIDALIQKKAIGKVIPSYMKLPAAYSNVGGFGK